MRKETDSTILLRVFLMSVALCANLVFAGTVKNPLLAIQNRNVSSLSADGATELRRVYPASSADDDASERRRCPLCDKSVYPYCGEKLFHDACCCTNPYQYPLPYKCKFADCAFLHANSCVEHFLISDCCCSDDYRSLLRGLILSDPTPTSDSTTVKN